MARRLLLVAVALAALGPGVLAQDVTSPRSRALAAVPEGPVPSYVVTSSENLPDWLFAGAELRVRYEDRSGRLRRRWERTELAMGLTRARLYLGVSPKSSPLSFAVELMDARQFGTDFPESGLLVNDLDILQLRARLDLERRLDLPLAVELGRFAFDAMDRRLIARNRFRNTVNAFDGVRAHVGDEASGKALQLLALWPAERRVGNLDRPDEDRKLLGAIAHVSGPSLLLEPYYLYYASVTGEPVRLHTTGAHLAGPLAARFDHDLHLALQLGSAGEKRHRAWGLHAELGRSFPGAWAPRLAAWLDYATGDGDPDDEVHGRFDPLFGAPHPKYGFTDLFNWQNMMSPSVGLSVRPHRTVRLSVSHRFQWLASSRDAWPRTGLLDPTGESGSFVGQELDVELRWAMLPYTELNVQYGDFYPGGFVEETDGVTGARGVYVAVTVGTE